MRRSTLSILFAVAISVATVSPVPAAQSRDGTTNGSQAYRTKTGKTIIVSETHPDGRSLSTIEVRTEGFEHDFGEVSQDRDPVTDVFLADLDGNGFDEIYIVTTAAGFGSYGSVLGFASNKDKSLSMIYFPAIREGDAHFDGHMGHDSFTIEDRKLVRMFPLYNKGDTNEKPTGGKTKAGVWSGSRGGRMAIKDREIGNA